MSVAIRSAPTQPDLLGNADPQVTFVFNMVYRPEFISAAVISSLISGCGLRNLPQAATPIVENPHSLAALPLYAGLLFLLLRLSTHYRRRFAPIRVTLDVQRGPLLKTIGETIRLRDVTRITESLSRFFGRRIRELEVADMHGRVVTLQEVLFGYDGFKEMLRELCPVSQIESAERPQTLHASRMRWDARHANFLASEDPVRFHSNTPFVVCLILLLIVDGLFNIFAQSLLIVTGHPDLVVYLTPASLLVSALATRFGYYYLFTAVSLNPQRKL